VKHTRLKGGAHHHLDYPIFFANIDVQEISTVGWSMWPLFKVNSPYSSFCSFNEADHLKDFQPLKSSQTFWDKIACFLKQKSGNVLDFPIGTIQILTHLTYFGYCFNPISIYYIWNKHKLGLEAIIAEVSNTPWIEMHSYLLHESAINCKIDRTRPDRFQANWKKEFHVSPFMEMDYNYDFTFYNPTEGGEVKVHSKMMKAVTNETWFTANFSLKRIEFTPFNLIYVLFAYPLQTRLIQVYIHIEALKLYLKGVPFFDHPEGTDVNFGFGITGNGISKVFEWLCLPFRLIHGQLFASKEKNG
jgi:hypothetical protein